LFVQFIYYLGRFIQAVGQYGEQLANSETNHVVDKVENPKMNHWQLCPCSTKGKKIRWCVGVATVSVCSEVPYVVLCTSHLLLFSPVIFHICKMMKMGMRLKQIFAAVNILAMYCRSIM